jgi:hypothetical protein
LHDRVERTWRPKAELDLARALGGARETERAGDTRELVRLKRGAFVQLGSELAAQGCGDGLLDDG